MPGKTIALTIDSGLQQEVERVLVQVGSEYSPKSATAIAVDPSTGAILALANWVAPGQSANIPADQAVGFSYEPGSTFKAITVAGALQDGLVTPGTQFDIPPSLSFASNEPPIHDAEDHGYETLTVAGILKFSSNIGADLIGQRLGAQRFNGWVDRFGFGSPTGIDLPGEAGGIILPPSRYSGASMYNLPFGQGESVTPMQMVAAYDAIATAAPCERLTWSSRWVASRRCFHRATGSSRRPRRRSCATCSAACSPTAVGFRRRDPRLRHGRQDRHREHRDRRPLLRQRLRGVVHRDGAHQPSAAGRGGRRQPAAGLDLRRSVAAPAFQQIVGWAVPYLGIPPK